MVYNRQLLNASVLMLSFLSNDAELELLPAPLFSVCMSGAGFSCVPWDNLLGPQARGASQARNCESFSKRSKVVDFIYYYIFVYYNIFALNL